METQLDKKSYPPVLSGATRAFLKALHKRKYYTSAHILTESDIEEALKAQNTCIKLHKLIPQKYVRKNFRKSQKNKKRRRNIYVKFFPSANFQLT